MQSAFAQLGFSVEAPIVNVASVTHISPVRYPGGKTWLVPRAMQWLESLESKPSLLIDPFLGGGSVPLAALSQGMVDRLLLYELDDEVAAVWRVIFSSQAENLSQLILDFNISRESVVEVVESQPRSLLKKAFRTIVKNRTYRGGILAHGSSMVNAGENGKGVASRWYPNTLANRIRAIQVLADRVTFVQGNGLDAVKKYACGKDVALFIDPPYTAGSGKRAGKRLYTHHDVDHAELFRRLGNGSASTMLTYDFINALTSS